MIDVEGFNKMSPEEQKKILNKRVATKKVRCKNWPACKDLNCIFAHPTETVCLYIILLNIIFIIFIYLYSVLIFQLVLMEINAVTFILVFPVDLVIIVQELDVLILILQDLILVWVCILIWCSLFHL